MQLYQAKVRLAGSMMNEVFKPDLSAPEIMLLRAFHGQDAVVDIKKTRVSSAPSDDERERLMALYMGSANNDPEQAKNKNVLWMTLFGHATAELPKKLPGDWPSVEPEDEVYVPRPLPKKRGPNANVGLEPVEAGGALE